MRLRFVQSLLAVALLASVLGLAGCGGKEDGSKLNIGYFNNSNFPHQKWYSHIEKSIL